MSDSQLNPNPPKERSTVKVVLIIVASLMLVGLLGCCGMLGLAYFGFNSGLDQQLRPQLTANPIIQEELGEIESISFDFGETVNAAQSRPGEQVMTFEVEGSKGSGTVLAKVNQGGNPEMLPILLKTSDGREIDLVPTDDDADPEEPAVEDTTVDDSSEEGPASELDNESDNESDNGDADPL